MKVLVIVGVALAAIAAGLAVSALILMGVFNELGVGEWVGLDTLHFWPAVGIAVLVGLVAASGRDA